jgi:hypothetical protein
MELLNSTKMTAGYTMGMDRDGRESLVVAVKGTFSIPDNGGKPFLSEEQEPLIAADVYSGEPGLSAPVYETDYAPFKPRCDVILNGSAYAPRGKPAKKVPVSLRMGSMSKVFNVIGNRCWEKTLSAVAATPPAPFTMMPISYNQAFGGTDSSHRDPTNHRAFMENPVGVGFHANLEGNVINGKPLPNTEQIGEEITRPDGIFHPMSFGTVGRGWEPRYRFAGTYDQNWIDNVFPFLPADFNDAYFQCAPADQQTGYPAGGETVELINLTPQGRTVFQLPEMEVPVVFFRRKGERHETRAVADTLVLEPDLKRLMITWRASLSLRKNMFEIPQVLVGTMSRGWWRARELGKTYYSSLEALCEANRKKSREDIE